MKKVLSVILVLSMLLSYTVIFADDSFTSEVTESDASKLGLLSALGFLQVFKDTEMLYADKPVTRAEFVAMAMALINADDNLVSDKLWFSDVLSENAFFDDVSKAAALGVVSGYSDGTFCPENTISYDETVAVIMKALGYRVMAEINGGWNMGYNQVADDVGLTRGVKINNYTSLSRIEAVRLIYNALNCPVFRTVGYGEFVRYEADENSTVLSEHHDIYKTEGCVNATHVSALVGYNVTNIKNIQIGDVLYHVDNNSYIEYLGYYVDLYYKDDGNTQKEVIYIVPDDKLEQLVIKADDITRFDNLTYYYDERSKVQISANHALIVNGKRLTEYDDTAFVPKNGEVILLAYKGDYNTVIINTFHNMTLQRAQKGAYTIATFTSKFNYRMFEVDMSRKDLRFDLYVDGQKFEFEEFTYQTNTDNFFDDADFNDTPVTTNKTYTFPVIPEGAVASIFADEFELINGFYVPSENAKFIKIYITTDYVEGTVDVVTDDGYITIDGKEYKVASENTLVHGNERFTPGVYGRFVFDCDGKVASWLSDIYAQDGYVYGYLIHAEKQVGDFSNTLEARILKKDGKVDIFEFAQKVRVNAEYLKNADKIKESLEASAALLGFKMSQLIKYKLNDERKIIEIQTVRKSIGKDGTDNNQLIRDMERTEFNHSENMLQIKGGSTVETKDGKVEYPADSKIYSPNIYSIHFVVPETEQTVETFNEMDYWVQDTWRVNFSRQDWIYDGWGSSKWMNIDVFDCNEFNAPNAVVIYEDRKNWDYVQSYVLVEKITQELSPSGSQISVLHGYDGWGSVAYYSYDDKMFDGLNEGDFVKLYGKGELIINVEMVKSLEEVRNCDLNTLPTDYKNDVFEVYAKKESSKNFVLQRGALTNDGKREYQCASYFRGGGGPMGGFKSGPLFYGEGENPVFSYFYSGIRDSFTDIKTVKEVGTDAATRVYVRQGPGLTAIVIYDLEE